MAIQSEVFSTEFGVRTFISTKHIATKQNVAVWLRRVSDETWVQLSATRFELINNSVVLDEPPSASVYSLVEVRVADEQDELGFSISEIAIVASIADEVVEVGQNIDSVVTVAGNTANINIVADNDQYVEVVGININSVITNATDIGNINTVANNITNVNNVGDKAVEVGIVSDNMTSLLAVEAEVIPNLPEILLADDNAAIATQKAYEADQSAMLAASSEFYAEQARDSAEASAVTATNRAVDASNSAQGIADTAYALTQIGIALTEVIDGELVMYYNDPITNISLNSNQELVIEY